MIKSMLGAASLLAISLAAGAASPTSDLNDLHQRQFRYARAMMQLNQLEGFEHGPSINGLLDLERDAKAKRAGERWHDPADMRAQSIDAFAKAVEHVATSQRAKRTMSRQWQIDEPYPSHWSVSGNEAAAADCARAIEHPLGQPLRIEMNRDGVAWLRVVAPGKGYWAFDTLVSEFDTKLSVYRDCRDIGSEAKQVSDDTVGLGSIVGLNADAAGQTFLIKLERKGGVGSLAIAKSVLAGSISGRVARAIDGQPIAGAYVVALPVQTSSAPNSYSIADANGDYSVPIYEEADYLIRANDTFLGVVVPEIYPSAVCVSNLFNYTEFCTGIKTPIHAGGSSSIEGIDFFLDPGAKVSGYVADETTGAPIHGVGVVLVANEDVEEIHTGHFAQTDEFGRFDFQGLAARSWRAEFSAPRYRSERWADIECIGFGRYACDPGSGTPFQTVSNETSRLDVRLKRDRYLKVHVLREGMPANGTFAALYSLRGDLVANDSEQQDWLELGPLPPGSYRLVAGASRAFTKVYGGNDCEGSCGSEPTSGLTIEIEDFENEVEINLRALPILRGNVTGPQGEPIPSVMVRLMRSNSTEAQVLTNTEGDYEFSAVNPGRYALYFAAEGFLNEVHPDIPCEPSYHATNCPGGTELGFGLASAPVSTMSASLNRSAGLSGHVFPIRSESSTSDVVRLSQLNLAGDIVKEWQLYMKPGAFSIPEVNTGTYLWGARRSGFRNQVFNQLNCGGSSFWGAYQGCDFAAAEPIASQPGQTREGVNFALTSAGSRLARVTDENTGVPIAGLIVDQWTLDGVWLRASITNAQGWAEIFPNDSESAQSFHAVQVSTDSLGRYIEEVYDNLQCPVGLSVYRGGCSLSGAWAVPISDGDSAPFAPLLIQLRSADPVFESGFE